MESRLNRSKWVLQYPQWVEQVSHWNWKLHCQAKPKHTITHPRQIATSIKEKKKWHPTNHPLTSSSTSLLIFMLHPHISTYYHHKLLNHQCIPSKQTHFIVPQVSEFIDSSHKCLQPTRWENSVQVLIHLYILSPFPAFHWFDTCYSNQDDHWWI